MNFKSNDQKKPTIQIVRKNKTPHPTQNLNAERSKIGANQIEKKSFGWRKSLPKKKKTLAFVSLELTHNSPNAVIIQMNKLSYVVVPGVSVMPAQGRSLSFAICFAAQDVSDIKRGDANEAEAIWANSNIKVIGKINSGDGGETMYKVNGMTGEIEQAFESTFLYSNNNTPISPEATAHHGITEYDVRFKRKISDFNLKREDFNVVWDGLVTKKLFWVNEVASFSRLINLHLLARFFTNNRQPIRMINFASTSTNRSVEELSSSFRNPLNKLRILPEIYEYIRKLAREKYGEDSHEFLAKISKARTIDDVPKLVAEYLAKKKAFEAKRKNYEMKKTANMINKVEAK